MDNAQRSELFWFVISPLFTAPTISFDRGKELATCQHRPEIILDSLWALPDLTMHSLSNCKNSID